MKSLTRRALFKFAIIAPAYAAGEDKAGADPKDPIIGKWKNIRSGTVMILSADGKALEYKTNFKIHGKWECIDDKALTRKYKVTWSDGVNVDIFRLGNDTDKLHGKDGKITSNRIKD